MAYRRTEKVLVRLAGRRANILLAALDLANRGGLDAVTVDDVAAAAGVAAGTLYLHFGDHADLLAAVIAEYLRRDLDAMTPPPSLKGPRAAAAAIAVFVHRVRAIPHLAPSLTAAPAYRLGIVRALEARIAPLVERDAALVAMAVYGALVAVVLAGLPVGRGGKNEPALISTALRAIGVAPSTAATLAAAVAA